MGKNRVDGVYDGNPRKTAGLPRFDTLNYMDALSRRLEVMDSAAVTLCMAHNLPIVVFDLMAPDGIVRAVRGDKIGTLVADTADGVCGRTSAARLARRASSSSAAQAERNRSHDR